MDKLLNPDVGLLITTVVTFLLLLTVLTKVAWKPIIEGINKREDKIRNDIERAEKSQKEAEALRLKYETQLADSQKTIQSMVSEAKADGEKTRNQLLADAKAESERILERGRKELSNETDRLKGELKQEVSSLSVMIAEKILKQAVDKKVQEQVLKDSLAQLSGVKK